MRVEIAAQGLTLTVGELRKALEGLDDAVPLYLPGRICAEGVVAEDLSVALTSEDFLWSLGVDDD